MPFDERELENMVTELAAARGHVAGYQIDSSVSDGAELIASAIVQAGTEIALSVAYAAARS